MFCFLLCVLRLWVWWFLFSGQLMDLVYAWTVPGGNYCGGCFVAFERAFPNEEHVEVLPSEDSPTETFRSFWGFSSARGVATVVETILEWIDVLVVTAFLAPLPVVSMVL